MFGHSGQLAAFAKRSWTARIIVGLAVLAATTRAVPALAPKVTISHHQYAAITWAGLAFIWLVWHQRRFIEREKDDEDRQHHGHTEKDREREVFRYAGKE